MRKTTRKLALHAETLRALANSELRHAISGAGSSAQPCLVLLAFDSGRIACETAVNAIASARCTQ